MNQSHDVSSIPIKFGKYKGRDLSEIIVDDSSYVIWLYKQTWIDDKIKEAISLSMSKIFVTFGKYNGNSLAYIKGVNKQYFDWLTKQDKANGERVTL